MTAKGGVFPMVLKSVFGVMPKLGIMLCLTVALAACDKGRKMEKVFPLASKSKLQEVLKDPAPKPGWEGIFTEFMIRLELPADRYEWQAPVEGSYRTVRYSGRKTTVMDHVGWFACGWAHYAKPPQGFPGPIVRIAATFKNRAPGALILLNHQAKEACRFAPIVSPTNAEGKPIPIPPIFTPAKGTETTRHVTQGEFETKQKFLVGQLQEINAVARSRGKTVMTPEQVKAFRKQLKARLDAKKKSVATPAEGG